MRKPHRLKPNEVTELPQHAVVVDTETYQKVSEGRVEHYLRLGYAAYVNWDRRREKPKVEYACFTSPDEFYAFLYARCKQKRKVYLLAHNIDFDLAVLGAYTRLPADNWKLMKSWERQGAYYREWYRDKCTLVCLSTTNLWPMTLEALGECIGLPKLKVDFATATDDELRRYCLRDVEILVHMWVWWLEQIRDEDLGCFKPTIASQAFAAYRHKYMTYDIYIHTCDEAIRLERSAYHGGRVECLRLGRLAGEPIYVLDVNSMYPFVMKVYDYPTKLKRYYTRGEPDLLARLMNRYLAIAHVQVETDEPVYCVSRNDELIFPVGKFWAYLCTPELKYALSRGHIRAVREYALYQRAPIFLNWVEDLYALRLEAKQEGNLRKELLYKLLLNSLYGKFGQKIDVWKQIGLCKPNEVGVVRVINPKTGQRKLMRMREGVVEVHDGEVEGYESMVAIPAHVTAYARMYLWHLMTQAGLEHVYYVDTDCLWVDTVGYERLMHLVHPVLLGGLKLEQIADSAMIYGPKDYVIGTKTKHKGIRATAVQLEDGVYEQEKWLGYKSRLRKGYLNVPVIERCIKRLRRNYTKGDVQEDGTVRPIVLDEDEPVDG